MQLRLGGRIVERGGGLPHQLVLKLHLGALVIVAAEIFAHLCAQVFIAAAADGLGELVLRTVFTTLADLMHLADKLGVLAGQFRGVVLCGERHMHAHLVAGAAAHELIFKAGDERAAAERERLVLGSAAGELHAVGIARVIEHQLVASLGGAVGDGFDAGMLLLELHQARVQLFFGNFHVFQRAFQAAILKFHSFSLITVLS